MTNEEIRECLLELADAKYQEFSSALIPGCRTMLGVRIPKLREFAKQLAKGEVEEYLQSASDEIFEEVMLQGMVIGYSKCDIEKKLEYAKNFIPKITDWSINDSFCSGMKCTIKHRERVFEFLQEYVSSEKEFEQRFVAVMLMDYFLTEEYIDQVLAILDGLKNDGYYTKMGVAWAIATAYAKFPEQTHTYMTELNTLDDFTYNKSIQKMIESYRISPEQKEIVRKLKR